MKEFDISLDNAVFTYVLHTKKHKDLSQCIYIEKYGLYLSYSKKTEVLTFQNTESFIYVVGLCVDSYGEIERYNVPEFLLQSSIDISDVVKTAARFAGNYVIFISLNNNFYAFSDATACMQINYALDEICLSSFDHVVATTLALPIDNRALRIRMSSDFVAAMPNDITIYKRVKTVLADHYINITNRTTTRYYPYGELQYFENPYDILKRQVDLIDNIVKEYAKYYKIICPLTSGWDSRVVFSFLLKNIEELSSYIFVHKYFTETTDDLRISRQICSHLKIPHREIPDLVPDEAFINAVYNVIGKYYYRDDIAMAYTYKKTFGEAATINGNIIDHLGKSSLVNLLPIWCATAAYFTTKERKISMNAKREVGNYLKLIKNNKITSQYVYDLFGIEDQCGRLCGYFQNIYAAAGITLLNIFNSHAIIDDWVRIKHKDRKLHCIHLHFLNTNNKRLLQFPFNPDEKFKFVGNSKVLFFCATYIRHFIRMLRKPHLKQNKGY